MKRITLYIALLIMLLLIPILVLFGKNFYLFVRGEQISTNLVVGNPDFTCAEESLSDPNDRAETMTAVSLYQAAIRGPFPQWRAWYRSGQAYCRLGQYEMAKYSFERYLSRTPNSLGFIELGFVHDHLLIPQKAVENWAKGSLTEEDLIEAARSQYRERQYMQSARWYQRASYFGRDYSSATAYLTFLDQTTRGETPLSFNLIEEAINVDSGWDDRKYRVDAYMRMGKKYLEGGEFNNTINTIEKILPDFKEAEIEPYQKSEAYRLIGVAQWNLNQLTNSLANLETAVSIDPENPYAQIHYGKVLFELDEGSTDTIQSSFITALELVDYDPDIFKNLFNFWLENHRKDLAQELCQIAEDTFGNANPREICISSNR